MKKTKKTLHPLRKVLTMKKLTMKKSKILLKRKRMPMKMMIISQNRGLLREWIIVMKVMRNQMICSKKVFHNLMLMKKSRNKIIRGRIGYILY